MKDLRTDLNVRWHGRADEGVPTLVFLHGLTDSGAGWPEAVDHWHRDYAILTVDQRGHGLSPRFTKNQLAGPPGEVMVQDAIAILAQLDTPPVVVGHSMGGAVALALGVRRADLVRGLVLEDPAPRGPEEPQRDARRGDEIVTSLRPSIEAGDEQALLRLRQEQHPDWPESELLVTGRAERQMDRDYAALGDFKPTAPWPELFAAVQVPTMVVSGDAADEICIDAGIEKGIADIGNSNVTLTRISGAGHCIRREQPQRYYEVVDDWLRAHRS